MFEGAANNFFSIHPEIKIFVQNQGIRFTAPDDKIGQKAFPDEYYLIFAS